MLNPHKADEDRAFAMGKLYQSIKTRIYDLVNDVDELDDYFRGSRPTTGLAKDLHSALGWLDEFDRIRSATKDDVGPEREEEL